MIHHRRKLFVEILLNIILGQTRIELLLLMAKLGQKRILNPHNYLLKHDQQLFFHWNLLGERGVSDVFCDPDGDRVPDDGGVEVGVRIQSNPCAREEEDRSQY